jgi:hypothetical protein
MDSGDDGESWAHWRRISRIIENDLHGDSLRHFREIASCIVGRQERELRAAGGRDFDNSPVEQLSRVSIDTDLRRITDSHIRELCLTDNLPEPTSSC